MATDPAMRFSAGALLLLLATGCSGDRRCSSDVDCAGPGTRCDIALGLCRCTTSAACAEDEACNSAGICQGRPACRSNQDCPTEGTVCELGSGLCVEGPGYEIGSICSSAAQCPYGAICTDRRCVPGCFDHGDCPLGQLCREGRCRAEADCAASDFCRFGSLCDEGRCRRDRRGSYCQPCPPVTPADPSPCGPPGSLCLLNSYGPGPEAFCGVDCSDGQPCPNGYVCSPIATDTGSPCGRDADCPAGRTCLIGEGRLDGFCACVDDTDCPADECDAGRGACLRTGVPCREDGPACPMIRCVQGACVVGRNCVPEEGLDCEALTSAPPRAD